MSSIICCRHPRTKTPDVEERYLRTLQVPSAESVPLSKSAVPHQSDNHTKNAIEDEQALRDMFATPSSIRGYQAAAKGVEATGFDPLWVNTELGRASPSKLQALGHAVKQKISKSRLSKESSKISLKPKKKHQTNEAIIGSLDCGGVSYRSTGLSDLLLSRAVSEGGYDIDAKDVHTPKLAGQTASFKFSPDVGRVLRQFEESPNNEATPAAKKHDVEPVDLYTPVPKRSQFAGGTSLQAQVSVQTSSWSPTTPLSTSFSDLVHDNMNMSPEEFLRRLSNGFANGTIQMPSMPELIALQGPDIEDVKQEHRLSHGPLHHSSSLGKGSYDVHDVLKVLAERAEKASRDSLTSNSDEERAILFSELHPTLLDYLKRFNDLHVRNQSLGREAESGSTQPKMQSLGTSVADASDNHDNSTLGQVIDEKKTTNTDLFLLQRDHQASSDCRDESDGESIHLNQMRISQHLASISMVHMPSPDMLPMSSDHEKLRQRWPQLKSGAASMTRFSSSISQERNKKPSDPKTKKLFENIADDSKLYPGWKRTTSLASNTTDGKGQKTFKDDASSIYLGEGELPGSSAASMRSVEAQGATNNMNSLAVGGRCASLGLHPHRFRSLARLAGEVGIAPVSRNKTHTRKFSETGMELVSSNLVIPQARTRGSSISRFTEEGIANHVSGPRRQQGSTEANEDLSEASTGAILDRRNENMSDLGAETQVRNSQSTSDRGSKRSAGQLSDHKSSHGRIPEWVGSVSKRALSRSDPEFVDRPQRIPTETATETWDKALWKAKNQAKIQDRTGSWIRPFRSRQSLSAANMLQPGGPLLRRSHSEDQQHRFSIEEHQQLCVEARRPLSPADSTVLYSRKPSTFNLRRLTLSGTTAGVSGKSTPSRDLLSWARFPSHTRAERCGPAGLADRVQAQDFSQSSASLILPENPSPEGSGFRSPGSWRHIAGKHKRRKSKSMIFFKKPQSPIHPRSPGSRRPPIWHWRNLYQSESSNLRDLTHRSSTVSADRPSKYPELDIPAGFGSLTPFQSASKLSSDRLRITEVSVETEGDTVGQGRELLSPTSVDSSLEPELFGRRSDDSSSRDMPGAWASTPKAKATEPANEARKDYEHPRNAMQGQRSEDRLSVPEPARAGSGSYISVTRSNGFDSEVWSLGDCKREYGPMAQTDSSMNRRLVSTELRGSTHSFVTESERQIKADLQKALRMYGVHSGDGKEELMTPPKMCDLVQGAQSGSCEDVSALGGVDGPGGRR